MDTLDSKCFEFSPIVVVIVPLNVLVHPTEGRREAPLPTLGCNAWLGCLRNDRKSNDIWMQAIGIAFHAGGPVRLVLRSGFSGRQPLDCASNYVIAEVAHIDIESIAEDIVVHDDSLPRLHKQNSRIRQFLMRGPSLVKYRAAVGVAGFPRERRAAVKCVLWRDPFVKPRDVLGARSLAIRRL